MWSILDHTPGGRGKELASGTRLLGVISPWLDPQSRAADSGVPARGLRGRRCPRRVPGPRAALTRGGFCPLLGGAGGRGGRERPPALVGSFRAEAGGGGVPGDV